MTMTTSRNSLTAAAWSGPYELPHQTPVQRPSALMEVVQVIDDDMAFVGGSGLEPPQAEVITVVDTDPSTVTPPCGPAAIVHTELFRDGQTWAVKLEHTCSGPAAVDYAARAVDALIDNEDTIVEHLVWEAITDGTVPVVATDPTHTLALVESSFPLTTGDAGLTLIPSASVPYFANAGLLAYDNTRKVFTYGGVPVAVMTADTDPLVPEVVWVPTFTIWRSTLDSYPINNLAVNDFTTAVTRSYLTNIQRDLAVHVTVP